MQSQGGGGQVLFGGPGRAPYDHQYRFREDGGIDGIALESPQIPHKKTDQAQNPDLPRWGDMEQGAKLAAHGAL